MGSVLAECKKSTEVVDFLLGFETEFGYFDYDDDGNCIEPGATRSCDLMDWSTDERNATLFTCSEKEGTCIDAALVCNGITDCPNGEDEVP